MMRFKLDENMPLAAAEPLVAAGHDVSSVFQQGLVGRPDDSIAAVCKVEKRAMVTADLDFADIRQYPPEEYAGIIVLRIPSQTLQALVSCTKRVCRLLQDEPLEGRLWVVTEHSIRVRD
jgi:predicted nuclease of predicted toxin-antitoxin system